MKLGVVARLDVDRGLGIQTQDLIRQYGCSKVLWVEMGDEQMSIAPSDVCGYTEGRRSVYHSRFGLPANDIAWLVEGMDALYSVETYYDDNIVRHARTAGVRTVLHANLELFSVHNERPSVIWAPTPWRPITMRGSRELNGYVQVPMPEPTGCIPPQAADPDTWGLRILFVLGREAMEDRNGLRILQEACRHVRERDRVEITVGGAHPSMVSGNWHGVPVHAAKMSHERWNVYEGQHLLVLPRRYGGLSLGALEAIRCGLGVVMSDTSPNEIYTDRRIPGALEGKPVRMKGGHARMFNCDPELLGIAIDGLARDPELVAQLQEQSRTRARLLSWDSLRPVWDNAFELALSAPA